MATPFTAQQRKHRRAFAAARTAQLSHRARQRKLGRQLNLPTTKTELRRIATQAAATWPMYKGHLVIILPPYLYDELQRSGHDMGYYIKEQPIPVLAQRNMTATEVLERFGIPCHREDKRCADLDKCYKERKCARPVRAQAK